MRNKKDVRTRAEAKKLMWEYYRDNKTSLPKWIGEYREKIIDSLILGKNPQSIFDEVLICET